MEIYKYYTLPKDVTGRYAASMYYIFSTIKFPIYIEKGNRRINAKSIIGILSTGYKKGDIMKICIANADCNIGDIISSLSELA